MESSQSRKNPNATWANREVMKQFQMVVDEFVKFYKAHGKDKNRDSFIFIRIALKNMLNLLFQERMPDSASVDLYTITNGINMILNVIDEKKIGKEKDKEFKIASRSVTTKWKDFSNFCSHDITIESQRRIALKAEEEKRTQLEGEASNQKAKDEDSLIMELTHRPKKGEESSYAVAFLYTKEELKKQINTIGEPKPRNYSPISLLKHAYAYYPKSMGASTVLEILGITVGGIEWLNQALDGRLDEFLHLDQTGITHGIALSIGAITIGGIVGGVALFLSSNCNTSTDKNEPSETESEEQELDNVQKLKDKQALIEITLASEKEVREHEDEQSLLEEYNESKPRSLSL